MISRTELLALMRSGKLKLAIHYSASVGSLHFIPYHFEVPFDEPLIEALREYQAEIFYLVRVNDAVLCPDESHTPYHVAAQANDMDYTQCDACAREREELRATDEQVASAPQQIYL